MAEEFVVARIGKQVKANGFVVARIGNNQSRNCTYIFRRFQNF